jgi:hypothetical protein
MLKAVIVTMFLAVGLFAVGSAVQAANGGKKMSTDLTGAEEAPGPGDADGSGYVTLRLNPGRERICYTLEVEDIAPATAAHIHEAPAGSPGPVVVPLAAPTDGSSSGCVDVDREEILEIMQDPEEYYVNVHNADYPGGAVRGQLGD